MRVHAAFLIACATATMLSLLPPHFPSFVSNFEMCRRGRNFKLVLVSLLHTHTDNTFGTIDRGGWGKLKIWFFSCALKLF